MTVLQILDEIPSNTTAGASDWYPQVEHALGSPDEWVTAIARIGELSDEHAWSLLSWIEVAASRIVRTDSRGTLVSAAFAMCLVLQSQLDRRDCSVVASLLRRAAEISILDFAACVAEGCGQAGSMGQEASRLLLDASPTTPATHVESGDGETFLFERRTHRTSTSTIWNDGSKVKAMSDLSFRAAATTSKTQLAAFLDNLAGSLIETPENWEN